MLFGGKKKEDEADDEAMKKMGEQMQKLSEMIGKLQQELAAKTAEADTLRSKAAQSTGNEVALKDANAQMEVLRKQIGDLQKQAQQATSAAAPASAGAKPADTPLGSIASPVQKEVSSAAGSVSAGGTAASTPAASTPAAGGMTAGATAYVMRAGGLPLRLRAGPSLDQEILDRLKPGSSLTLLEGPQQADGHGWWRVRTVNGHEGWVAGENLVLQPD